MSKTYTQRYLCEAPTGEGPDFDKPITPSTDINPSDYKDFYLKGKLSSVPAQQDTVAEIIVKVKEYILNQPNKIFADDYKSFRDIIVSIILEVVPNLGKTAAGWSARMIQSYMLDKGIIVDERNGFRLDKPIKTVEVVKDLGPKLDAVLSGDDTDTQDDDSELGPEMGPLSKKELYKPRFDVNIRYEKYSDDFDESLLTPEESEALDAIRDGDTGKTIIQKIQTKRAFKTKSEEEVCKIVEALINKGGLVPGKGYDFHVAGDMLPSFTAHRRQFKENKNIMLQRDDDKLMFEAYVNKGKPVLEEGMVSNLKNRVVSQFPTFAPQAAAQAQGNLQASKQSDQLYKAFLQQLGASGYNASNVPGSFMVGWLSQNLDPHIATTYPEAQKANINQPLQNTQATFNQILQAYNRQQATGGLQPSNQPGTPGPLAGQRVTQAPAGPQAATPQQAATPKGKGGSLPSGFGIPKQEYDLLMANITNAKDARAKTRAVNNFMKKHAAAIAAQGGAQPPQPGQTTP
jgi:hypothetical protein